MLRAIGTVMQVYRRLREGTQHTSRHHIMAEGRAQGMPAAGKRCRLWCVHMHVRCARSTRHAARILAERHAGCSEAHRLQHPTRERIRCHHCSHGSMNSRLVVQMPAAAPVPRWHWHTPPCHWPWHSPLPRASGSLEIGCAGRGGRAPARIGQPTGPRAFASSLGAWLGRWALHGRLGCAAAGGL